MYLSFNQTKFFQGLEFNDLHSFPVDLRCSSALVLTREETEGKRLLQEQERPLGSRGGGGEQENSVLPGIHKQVQQRNKLGL